MGTMSHHSAEPLGTGRSGHRFGAKLIYFPPKTPRFLLPGAQDKLVGPGWRGQNRVCGTSSHPHPVQSGAGAQHRAVCRLASARAPCRVATGVSGQSHRHREGSRISPTTARTAICVLGPQLAVSLATVGPLPRTATCSLPTQSRRQAWAQCPRSPPSTEPGAGGRGRPAEAEGESSPSTPQPRTSPLLPESQAPTPAATQPPLQGGPGGHRAKGTGLPRVSLGCCPASGRHRKQGPPRHRPDP